MYKEDRYAACYVCFYETTDGIEHDEGEVVLRELESTVSQDQIEVHTSIVTHEFTLKMKGLNAKV